MASTSEQAAGSVNRAEFGKNPDVTFVFPNSGGAILLAEKLKLASKSDVFKNQFTCDTNDKDGAQIAITDISFDTFNKMVMNIYEKRIVVYEGNYLEILYAARKYFVNSLTTIVIKFIKSFLNDNNLADQYEFIEKFHLKILNDHVYKLCISFPIKIIGQLTNSVSHKQILRMILESPTLGCSSEYELYEAVVNMLKKNTTDITNATYTGEDFRKELGKMVNLIRFPCMSVNELVLCGRIPSLLTTRQLIDCLLWVQEEEFTDTLQDFSTNKRMFFKINNKLHYQMCQTCRGTKILCMVCKKYF
ncbi:uncharacterized protein LOC129810332 [Phlebotomus papatasi]|uniref:uncharacterized protein LOC129810332 n=1 Tax=Phlebotomus papatasi TaxID=29031 RepID=UPI0024842798|nr:uncharacterized protein LOC129810332 [Phlebotomus papatasi]